MAEDPIFLVRAARLDARKKAWPEAIDCLERALPLADAELLLEIAAAASEIEGAPGLDGALRGRARALAVRAGSTGPPSRAAPGSARDLEVARRLLATPSVLRALGEALASAPQPADGRLSMPVEDVVARLFECELDLAPVLELALDLVLRATGAARAFVLVRDERGKLQVSRGRGLERRDLDAAFSRSVLSEAERTGRPVFVADALADERFGGRESVQGLGLRSVACVPVTAPGSDEVLAVIYLDDPRESERFDARAQMLLGALGRAIAVPLRNARRFAAQRVALDRVRGASGAPTTPMVGRSAAILRALELLAKVAPEDVPVLVEGESGTGKELAARIIHDLSPRREQPFVAENLGALAPSLLEAELFGFVKGAFTGADHDRDGLFVRAQGGTVFLDEVGELPLEGQVRLLRVLQEREVRPVGATAPRPVKARVVAATNRDLAAMVREGTFREDLFYRLRVVAVRLPPLRERLEDVPLLAQAILDRIALTRGEPVSPLSREALAKLVRRPWKGNVRELENVLWGVALSGESALDAAPVAGETAAGEPLRVTAALTGDPVHLEEARVAFDRIYLGLVLGWSQRNIARAARALGISRESLSRALKRLGMS